MTRLMTLFNRTTERQPAELAPAAAINPPDGPPLILLVPEASGANATRPHSFPDASALADYISFWFPHRLRQGLVAFWALPDAPADPAHEREVVVLVRDEHDAEIAYAFSFLDLESALEGVRAEVPYGLPLERVCVYWAARVEIGIRDDAVTVSPATQPPMARPVALPARNTVVRERPVRPATEPEPPQSILRPIEFLLSQLADALRRPAPNASRAAFQGFGSPPGRF